jgi:hypothetical protein
VHSVSSVLAVVFLLQILRLIDFFNVFQFTGLPFILK